MVRLMPIGAGDHSFSPIPLTIGLFVSASILVGLCAKHALKNIPIKFASKTSDPNTPRSPLPSPRKLVAVSHKAVMSFVQAKKQPAGVPGPELAGKEEIGLWQKAILMGEKCQPPDFSGAIYYDYSGNRIPAMPKSPRASPLRGFTFHVEKE